MPDRSRSFSRSRSNASRTGDRSYSLCAQTASSSLSTARARAGRRDARSSGVLPRVVGRDRADRLDVTSQLGIGRSGWRAVAGVPPLIAITAALALYFALAIIAAAGDRRSLKLPVLGLFCSGFSYVGVRS